MVAFRSAVRRTIAAAMVALGVLTVSGCLSDPLYTTEEIPKDQAAQQLDATFTRVRVPVNFEPLAATVTTTSWGSQARTVAAAFTTNRPSFDQFMTTVGTQGDPTWMKDTAGTCPADTAPSLGPSMYTAPDHALKDWYDRGTFQRCTAIESWAIASTEFADTGRSAGRIFVQPAGDPDTPDRVNVLIGTTIA